MTKRNFVTFNAAFPDESEWTENGSLLVPDGRSIGMVLAEALRNVGFSPSEVTQTSFYGWGFEVLLPKRKAWCLLQGGDPWLLLVEERGRGPMGCFGPSVSDEVDAVLRAIDGVLRKDSRFSSIRWFTKEEYEAGSQVGADSPV